MKVELLAPAGDKLSFISAINNGADAVYLGLDTFNARANISNFQTNELEELVSYAHLRAAKVYVALNTLIKDEEFEEVIKIIDKAVSSNVDAFIVQDVGLAFILRARNPSLAIHASTQMGIHNVQGAQFAKKFGFSRIILSRETPIDEIKRIKSNVDIEIEYFIQGALCVSFSGNCYFSQQEFGCSGNRGKCKQLCRLCYNLEKEEVKKKGYFLSAKDICMLPSLKELAEAGVDSFKIEGRARRAGYVATCVNIYRNAIDNEYNYDDNMIIKLKKAFNRGDFVSGYLKGEKIIFSQTQNHIGVKIGEVTKVNNGKKFNEVFCNSFHKLTKGDGIKIFRKGQEYDSLGIDDVKNLSSSKYIFTTRKLLQAGDTLHLILDCQAEKQVLEKNKPLMISAEFKASVGQCASLSFSCKDVKVTVKSDFPIEQAKNQLLTESVLLKQISRLDGQGDIISFKCQMGNIFMSKQQLNELRRKCFEKLKHEMTNFIPLQKKEINYSFQNNEVDKKIIFKVRKAEEVKQGCIYSPFEYDFELIKKLADKHFFYLELPVLTSSAELEAVKQLTNKNIGIVAQNYGQLNLTTKDKTIIGEKLNVFNSFSIFYYKNSGYQQIIISDEVEEELKNSGIELYTNNYYKKELMILKHCPVKEHFGSNCKNCLYNQMTLSRKDKEYYIIRKKLKECSFVLIGKEIIKNTNLSEVREKNEQLEF